jgi:hypothetical protein
LEVLAAASFLATLISGFAVGGRLLWLARATRHPEELLLGIAVASLTTGGVFEIAAMTLANRGSPEPAYPLEVVGILLHSLSAASLCFGVWRIFHPDGRWALALCALLISVALLSWLNVVVVGRHTSQTGFSVWFHLNVASRGAAFAWCAASSSAYHLRLRRRLALGLVEPFLGHRFLLWAIATGSSTVILAAALCTNTLLGVLVFAYAPALLLVSACGLVGAAALWLAFLPPAGYRRLVDSRAGTGDGT